MFVIVAVIVCAVIFSLFMRFSKRVPILMYHRIADIPGDRNSLPPQKFIEQLDYLSSHGYTTVSLAEVYDYYYRGKSLPPKPVVLTFDDGYEDNYSIAMPLLRARQMKATVFPISHWVGRPNEWENYGKRATTTMNWGELQEWVRSGMEVGSHTVNHPFLSRMTATQLEEELTASRLTLQEKLGGEMDILCYPYGDYNEKTVAAVKQAGYKCAVSIYAAPIWNLDQYALPRLRISSRQPLWEFALKISWLHTLFIVLRKYELKFKRKKRL